MFSIVAVYVISVYFLWSEDSARILRVLSVPVWATVLLYIAGISGALRVPLLFMIFGLLAVGYFTHNKGE